MLSTWLDNAAESDNIHVLLANLGDSRGLVLRAVDDDDHDHDLACSLDLGTWGESIGDA